MSVSIWFLLGGIPSILLFIVIGKIIQWFIFRKIPYLSSSNSIKESQWHDIFMSLVLGMIATLFIYSICCTKFKTVFICLIPILVAWFYIKYIENKEQNHIENKIPTKLNKILPINIFILLFINLFWTLSLNYQYIDFNSLSLAVDLSNLDALFYSRIAAALSISGNENIINVESLLDNNLSNVDLYHYFELWLSNFLSTVLPLPIGVVTSFIVAPLFLTTIVSAILALINNHIDIIKPKYFIASICVVYAHYFYLPIYAMIPKLQYLQNLCVHPFWGIKVGIYYIIGLIFILLTRKKSYTEALLALFMLPIFTITSLPTIFSTGILLILWLFYKKLVSNKQIVILTITLFLVTFMLFAFPILFPTKQISVLNTAKVPFELSYLLLKTKFNLFIGSIIQTIFVFLPYVIMLILPLSYNWFKNISYQILIILVAGITISGAATWTLLNPLPNSIQLLIFPAQTLITSVIYFGIVEGYFFYKQHLTSLITFKTKIKYYVISIILVFSLLYNIQYHVIKQIKQAPFYSAKYMEQTKHATFYSAKYIEQIKQIIKSKSVANQPIFIASHMDSVTINDVYPVFQAPILFRNGGYLSYFSNICFVYGIDDVLLLNTPKIYKPFFKNLSFYNYIIQHNNKTITLSELQANFLQEYKFSFLIISKDIKIPKNINKLVKQIFVDELSGERFIVLGY